MVSVLSTNITSPLGLTSEQNYRSIKAGGKALKTLRDWNGIPGQICAGVFEENQKKELLVEGFTWFESLVIRSVQEAAARINLDLSSPGTALIIGTTKANVDQLAADPIEDRDYRAPGVSAKKIARYLGISAEPLTVCNACISGITAQILADRLINSGIYERVVVCGSDTVNHFCVAGFNSFKALSQSPCRPFDIERSGLNIGECAATVILAKAECGSGGWKLITGHLDNDAYHVSAPSPSGEGVSRAISKTLSKDDYPLLATVCAHGTATMFNDQMESRAISDTALSDIPLTAYKGYYGHTLGAAGVIEPVLTMESIDDNTILPVAGFGEIGVSGRINVTSSKASTDKKAFLKIISGFGGCNGAALYSRDNAGESGILSECRYEIADSVRISSKDGKTLAGLTEIYKKELGDNPRFYKMDAFSRLVYAASAMLVKSLQGTVEPESVGMILFNKSGSIVADRQHIGTFDKPENYYPSPAVFINTLPNVVMGEIASKYSIKGETTFIILAERDEQTMESVIKSSLESSSLKYLVTGWADCDSEENFEADLKLIKKS